MAKIIKVKNLLDKDGLTVPVYQRPYKWSVKNVNQLIDDIIRFKNKSAYRLGTIVVHKISDNELEVVDGQQRVTTLVLLFKALFKNNKISKDKINLTENLKFSNPISIKNIKQNFSEIEKRVKEEIFDEELIEFILNRCEVVYVELDDIAEAFQFFDSQNARGKDLAPHDLLKAYHLREMQNIEESEKTKLIKDWEALDDKGELGILFENYLYKIRNWSRGKSARYFTKNDTDTFKGISINTNTKEIYPYALIYQIANVFVEDYNKDSARLVDFNKLDYPFSLDLPILNGKRFFEMVSYYHKRIRKMHNLKENEIIKVLNDYQGRWRVGDRYTRTLFECALIYYIDRFGEIELDRVIKKLFVWAYKLRLQLQAVRLASIDNEAINSNIFKTIRYATNHHEVVNLYIESLSKIKFDIKEIKEKFTELGYYNVKQ